MNGKGMYALRIVIGGYLVYLGLSLLIQMMNEKPENMALMSAMAVIFIIVGAVYAVLTLRKVLQVRKEEKEAEEKEIENDHEER